MIEQEKNNPDVLENGREITSSPELPETGESPELLITRAEGVVDKKSAEAQKTFSERENNAFLEAQEVLAASKQEVQAARSESGLDNSLGQIGKRLGNITESIKSKLVEIKNGITRKISKEGGAGTIVGREISQDLKEFNEQKEMTLGKYSRERIKVLWEALTQKLAEIVPGIPLVGPAVELGNALWGKDRLTGRKIEGKERLVMAGSSFARLVKDYVSGGEASEASTLATSTETVGHLATLMKDSGKSEKGHRITSALFEFMKGHDDLVRKVEANLAEKANT